MQALQVTCIQFLAICNHLVNAAVLTILLTAKSLVAIRSYLIKSKGSMLDLILDAI